MQNLASHLAMIKASGRDAAKLLQGQLTCNINTLKPNEPKLTALCNREGRVLQLFYVIFDGQDYNLITQVNMIEPAILTLKKYAVFYQVTLTPMISSINVNINWHLSDNIQTSIPTIYAETSGKFLPHECNLHALNAIDWDKGCYTGQEIIARLHYRGSLKSSCLMATLTISNNNHLITPKPGDDIFYQESPCGSVIDIAQNQNNLLVMLSVKNSILEIEKNKKCIMTQHHIPYFIIRD